MSIDDRRDGYGRGSIVVEVETPRRGEREGRLTPSLPTRRPRGDRVAREAVPGKYAADIRLPAKIDGDKALGASFSSRKQRITFTLPVS